MGTIVVLFVVTSLIWGALMWIARSGRDGYVAVAAVSAAVFILGCFASPAISLSGLAICVIAIVALLLALRPLSYAVLSLTGVVGVFAWLYTLNLPELRELRELRADYPLESIAPRLAYEPEPPPHRRYLWPKLVLPVEQRLSEIETKLKESWLPTTFGGRRYALQRIHERHREDFVMARGFGPVRMLPLRRKQIDVPESTLFALPKAPQPAESYGQDEAAAADPAATELPPSPDFAALLGVHTLGELDFLNLELMGYIKDRDHVAGFESHRFSTVLEPEGIDEWQITRLELVSLLKHVSPMVYISESLPQMETLKDAPTRPLDSFETDAVERLREQEDLVVYDGLNEVRMVGSLRAGQDCIECHSVNRGTLLGAFTYLLHRREPIPEPREGQVIGPQARLRSVGNGAGGS